MSPAPAACVPRVLHPREHRHLLASISTPSSWVSPWGTFGGCRSSVGTEPWAGACCPCWLRCCVPAGCFLLRNWLLSGLRRCCHTSLRTEGCKKGPCTGGEKDLQ